ncbi:tetratricopeptide repeat protein, partial [Clostridium sp.]|uniref:tetratricopeptide repeat protein n=1 Tax=Clostridium sp. TaxID=1506 RepID=UPI003F35020E
MLNLKSKNINKIIFLLICTVLVLTGVFITLKKYNKQEESYTLKLIEIIDRDEESRLTEDEIENYEVEINKELDTRLKDNKEMYKIKKTYYALGAIKYLQNEHSESIAYLNKALEYGVIDNEKKNIELDVRIYSALSSNHIIQQNIEESEIFFERAKTIALKNNEKHLLCELYYG